MKRGLLGRSENLSVWAVCCSKVLNDANDVNDDSTNDNNNNSSDDDNDIDDDSNYDNTIVCTYACPTQVKSKVHTMKDETAI